MKRFIALVFIATLTCVWTNGQTPARRPGSAARPSPAKPATRTPATQPKPTPTPAANSAPPVAAAAAGQTENCGCEVVVPEVVAVVNGIKISRQETDERLKAPLGELRRTVIEARQKELDLQINSKLLEAEAKRRGKTSGELLEAEVVKKAVEPTEADAQTFYDANKSRVQGEFKDIKGDLINYLREQRQREQAGKYAEGLRAAAQVKILLPNVTPPANDAERARVLAVVNGEQITSANIEDSLKPLIYSVQERTYQLRRQEVDIHINDMLLEQESQKRKLTAAAVLEAEVKAKAKPVTEVEARAFYDANRERINGEFAPVKDQIILYLQDAQTRDLQGSFAGELRKAAAIQTFLTAPEPPVLQIATDDQPAKGSPDAPVTIIEFTDFQCPSCAGMQPTLERLTTEYGARVRLVIRDFPLEMHENARKAAEAAEAARAQGKYFEYASLLFANQSALGVDKLKEYATRVGLDRQKFDAMLDSGQFTGQVQRDVLEGTQLGVNSTPSLFVNGRIVNDRTYEGLKAAIEKELAPKPAQ